MKKVLAILLVFAMLTCLMAGCGGDAETTTTATQAPTTTTTTKATTTTTTTSATTTTTVKVTYEDILTAYGIKHNETFSGLHTANYVTVANGYVGCRDIGYKGDRIVQMVDTEYYFVSDWSEDVKESTLEATKKSLSEKYGDIDCITVSYDMGRDLFKIRIAFDNLDNPENVSAIASVGYVSGGAQALSFSKTDSAVRNGGYIKK